MAIISSGIWDIDPTVTDGTQLAGYLNELVAAINTNQSSATRPPMIKTGGLWTKTLSGSSGRDIAVMVYDGTRDYEIGKIVGGEITTSTICPVLYSGLVYEGGSIGSHYGDLTVSKTATGTYVFVFDTPRPLGYDYVVTGSGTGLAKNFAYQAASATGFTVVISDKNGAAVDNTFNFQLVGTTSIAVTGAGASIRTEEVDTAIDEKLAIKNKLIEKLEVRLKKIEDQLKKKKK